MDDKLIPVICELQTRRKHHIKTKVKLTNAAGALVRRFMGWRPDHPDAAKIVTRAAKLIAGKADPDDAGILRAISVDIGAFRQQVEISETRIAAIELEMKRRARKLPAYQWAKSVRGLGELGFAVIVGEAGDLAKYDSDDKLRKRLGLAPMGGHAMSTWRRKGGLSADDWTAAGYSPGRRAQIYACVEEPLFRAQWRDGGPAGPYGEVYQRRRAATDITHEEWTKAQRHNDARRVMVQRLISDLWSEWRRAKNPMPQKAERRLPASELLHAEPA
jgi:hypothetical protein